MAAVLRDEPPWEILPNDTPQSVKKLLRRCVSREPKRRLRDIGEVRIAIEDYLADPYDSHAPAEAISKRRHAPIWIITGLLAGALLATIIPWALNRPSSPSVSHLTLSLSPSRPCLLRFERAYRPKRQTPSPGRLAGDGNTPFSEQVLDVSKAQREPVIEPHGMADDLRRKAVTTAVRLAAVHPGILRERHSS